MSAVEPLDMDHGTPMGERSRRCNEATHQDVSAVEPLDMDHGTPGHASTESTT
jgi:hypothetical protein